MDVQLDQLRALAAVVTAGTFDAAAAVLSITPSAVSQRIRALEASVGRVLVERSKPVQPTESGRAFLRLAREIDLLLADATTSLSPAGSATPSPIPIVVNADSLTTWVLPALGPLADRHVIHVFRDDEDHTVELLRNGTVMAAVTSNPVAVQGCSVRPLGRMRYRATASPAFRERWFGSGLNAETLGTAPMLAFDAKDDLQDSYLARRFPRRRLTPPRHLIPAAADFAAATVLGMGWSMLPEIQVAAELGAGTLVVLDRRPVDVPLYWQQWKSRSRQLDEVADVLAAAAERALQPPV